MRMYDFWTTLEDGHMIITTDKRCAGFDLTRIVFTEYYNDGKFHVVECPDMDKDFGKYLANVEIEKIVIEDGQMVYMYLDSEDYEYIYDMLRY